MLSQGVARLNTGLSVLIFPEGTRVEPGERKRYNKSGSVVACRAGVPVLPVAHNAGERWPGRHWVKRPGVLRVRIGEPIETAGRTSDEVLADVEAWIEAIGRYFGCAQAIVTAYGVVNTIKTPPYE